MASSCSRVSIPNLGALPIVASVSLTHIPCLFACFYESVSCVGHAAARHNALKQPRAIRVGPHQGGKFFGLNTGGLSVFFYDTEGLSRDGCLLLFFLCNTGGLYLFFLNTGGLSLFFLNTGGLSLFFSIPGAYLVFLIFSPYRGFI